MVHEPRQYSAAEVERMMKLQDVMLKAMAKKITWWAAAAEIIGVSDRTMRRWHQRLARGGRLRRSGGSAEREGQFAAGTAEDGGGGARLIS